MNYQVVSGLIEHQVAFIDQVIFLKVAEASSLKLWLHDLEQQIQEKKSIVYHIILGKNAEIIFCMGILNSLNLDVAIHLYLEGDGSKAEFFGVGALSEQQQISIKTFQKHYGMGTKSSLELKTMLKGQAHAQIESLIFIDQNASKTQASQENKNIVMGQNARVVSIPSIEVLEHDVTCCHGTAVGQFDEKHRWYLKSRGFDSERIHQILVSSFFGQIVQKFENNAQFMEMLCKKMV